MTGLYSIIPRVKTPSIDAGESIEIEVFLAGYGDVPKDNKLQITHSSPIFAQDGKEKVGYIETCIKVAKDPKGRVRGALTGNAEWKNPKTNELVKALHRHPVDPYGTTVELNEGYFLKKKEADRMLGKEVDEEDPRLLSELVHSGGHPPLLLKLNTLPNATKGDYDIALTLFYSIDSDLRMDQKIIKIHINSWIEKHQKKLQWLAAILASSALAAGIVQAVFTVLQFLK